MREQGISTVICSDVEMLARRVAEAAVTVMPLGPAPFRAEVVSCELGDLSVRVFRSKPLLGFGRIAPGRVHLLLPLTGHEQIILHGRRLEQHDIAVGPSGGPIDGASHGNAEWGVVMLPFDTARRLLFPEGQAWKLRAGQHYLLRADPSAWAGASSLLRSFREVFLEEPAVFDAPEPRRALRDAVLEAFRELLAGSPGGEPARRLRTSEFRRSVIDGVEAHLAAHPGHVPSVATLSESLGISTARLRAALQASFGLAPAEFLMRRRLAFVRAALRSSIDREQRAEDIARAHGFGRFADFARDYQAVFGEAISPEEHQGGAETTAVAPGGDESEHVW